MGQSISCVMSTRSRISDESRRPTRSRLSRGTKAPGKCKATACKVLRMLVLESWGRSSECNSSEMTRRNK